MKSRCLPVFSADVEVRKKTYRMLEKFVKKKKTNKKIREILLEEKKTAFLLNKIIRV